MRRNNGGVPRELRSELIYAAAAANAWLRGLSLPRVALHYRYEPVTALSLIARLCDQCGVKNVEPWVPEQVLRCALLSPQEWGGFGLRLSLDLRRFAAAARSGPGRLRPEALPWTARTAAV